MTGCEQSETPTQTLFVHGLSTPTPVCGETGAPRHGGRGQCKQFSLTVQKELMITASLSLPQ